MRNEPQRIHRLFVSISTLGLPSKDDWAISGICQTDNQAPGSKSVVIKDAAHGIPEMPEVGKAVAEFLKAVNG